MSSFECRACLKKCTSSAEFETHISGCRANRYACLKIVALGLELDDTEAQEKLGIRYNFTPDLRYRSKDESWDLNNMRWHLSDWGDAPLTEEFVSKLGTSMMMTEQFEQMRGRAVSALRNATNKKLLPVNTDRPPRDARKYQCRACSRVQRTLVGMHEHRIYCHVNREAYIKLKALGIARTNTEAQEELGIRFDCVRTIRGYTRSERLLDENMRSQLKAWGRAPLTEEFVSNLGYPSNLELLERRRMKTRAVPAPYQESLDGLLDLDTPKKRSLPDSDATPPRKRNRTSGPLPLEVLPGSSSTSPTRNQTSVRSPGLNNVTSRDRHKPKDVNQGVTHGLFPSDQDSSPTDGGTARFDAAFVSWLEREKVSKAAIGRLVEDPTLQPLTGLMTRNYIKSLEVDSEDGEEEEDEELVSRICGMPSSDIFY